MEFQVRRLRRGAEDEFVIGLSANLLTTAKARAHGRGADYVFLESGVARTEAHRFHLRHGATHAATAFRWTLETPADDVSR